MFELYLGSNRPGKILIAFSPLRLELDLNANRPAVYIFLSSCNHGMVEVWDALQQLANSALKSP